MPNRTALTLATRPADDAVRKLLVVSARCWTALHGVVLIRAPPLLCPVPAHDARRDGSFPPCYVRRLACRAACREKGRSGTLRSRSLRWPGGRTRDGTPAAGRRLPGGRVRPFPARADRGAGAAGAGEAGNERAGVLLRRRRGGRRGHPAREP